MSNPTVSDVDCSVTPSIVVVREMTDEEHAQHLEALAKDAALSPQLD